MQVERIPLPGIGTQHVFRTAGNRRVGVVRRRDGGRDLVISDAEDPDLALAVPLTGQEATTLAMLLGMVEVVELACPREEDHPGAGTGSTTREAAPGGAQKPSGACGT